MSMLEQLYKLNYDDMKSAGFNISHKEVVKATLLTLQNQINLVLKHGKFSFLGYYTMFLKSNNPRKGVHPVTREVKIWPGSKSLGIRISKVLQKELSS